MFEKLPPLLQEQIRNYLLENRFPEAKKLFDHYCYTHSISGHKNQLSILKQILADKINYQ